MKEPRLAEGMARRGQSSICGLFDAYVLFCTYVQYSNIFLPIGIFLTIAVMT